MKIGDKIYRFDGNVRSYDRNRRCIYEKHFVEHDIVGETKLSWVTDKGGFKISKRDGTCPKAMQFAGRGFFTFEEMQDDIWQHVHRYKIERLLVQASPDKLRKVAEIIGYQP